MLPYFAPYSCSAFLLPLFVVRWFDLNLDPHFCSVNLSPIFAPLIRIPHLIHDFAPKCCTPISLPCFAPQCYYKILLPHFAPQFCSPILLPGFAPLFMSVWGDDVTVLGQVDLHYSWTKWVSFGPNDQLSLVWKTTNEVVQGQASVDSSCFWADDKEWWLQTILQCTVLQKGPNIVVSKNVTFCCFWTFWSFKKLEGDRWGVT